MTTLNISLPETVQTFVEQQVTKGGYSNISEYILHLIFYLSFDDYIEIVRVLHASRDIEAILEQQEGE
jgi:Arc/MetJ-type ribon-helix-helix transcriptional regulator